MKGVFNDKSTIIEGNNLTKCLTDPLLWRRSLSVSPYNGWSYDREVRQCNGSISPGFSINL